MSPFEAGLYGFALLILLSLVGIQVGYALIITGFAGFAFIVSPAVSLSNLSIVAFRNVCSYNFAVLPLFLLVSAFVERSGIGSEAYKSCRAWFGQVRGGLAFATIAGSGLFAATTGSSLASTLAIGKVAFPEMRKYAYHPGFATGCIAAGGTLGILIPPSGAFILIGILTEQSIGKLFIAGILPGILSILSYFATIWILCKRNPLLGPPGPQISFSEKVKELRGTWAVIALFLLIMGGLYGGMFTSTEAGGIGAFGAMMIGLLKRKLPLSEILNALKETTLTSAMIIALLIGAFVFMTFLAASEVPYKASNFVAELQIPRYLVLLTIIIGYIILGMIFDIYAIVILTLPIIFPIMTALGYDPIWFSVIVVRLIEVGFVSPPFGINLLALTKTTNVPIGTIIKGLLPFLVADIVTIGMLIALPQICLFLPNLMG